MCHQSWLNERYISEIFHVYEFIKTVEWYWRGTYGKIIFFKKYFETFYNFTFQVAQKVFNTHHISYMLMNPKAIISSAEQVLKIPSCTSSLLVDKVDTIKILDLIPFPSSPNMVFFVKDLAHRNTSKHRFRKLTMLFFSFIRITQLSQL
jgi:hypothetical protein